ncbi:MAG: six-cysteine ranthipeptide SCIFF [Limnochordia bacterium]|nr:six-cysteine peptide SCIFF [Bacillota bacterium]
MAKTYKHVITLSGRGLQPAPGQGCGECQTSCQSACKTSCTVGNLTCMNDDEQR